MNSEQYDKFAFLLFRMECGIGLLDVIYECMRCGKYDTDVFVPAIYAAYDYFINLQQTLTELKDELVIQFEHVEPDENFARQHIE